MRPCQSQTVRLAVGATITAAMMMMVFVIQGLTGVPAWTSSPSLPVYMVKLGMWSSSYQFERNMMLVLLLVGCLAKCLKVAHRHICTPQWTPVHSPSTSAKPSHQAPPGPPGNPSGGEMLPVTIDELYEAMRKYQNMEYPALYVSSRRKVLPHTMSCLQG